jgi:uncharacterized protein (TIGR00290 family)
MPQKLLVAWSGGKDSALALYEILQNGHYEVVSLLTTLTADYDRISMHGVRRTLLELQAQALRLPLHQVFISKEATNEEYESQMEAALDHFRPLGVSTVVFGDIHLQDVRKYREDNLARAEMTALFPLWGRDSAEVATTFVELGFKAIVTCVDSKALARSFCGRVIDRRFLADLPRGVDPCGENGEFHSFVFDGPMFTRGVPFAVGETVERETLYFCDLVPLEATP